eukprot:bmy_03327T0
MLRRPLAGLAAAALRRVPSDGGNSPGTGSSKQLVKPLQLEDFMLDAIVDPAGCGGAERGSSLTPFSKLIPSSPKVSTEAAPHAEGMSGPRPVVLSGPSGAGKSTLLKRLLQEHSSIFGFSVSREAPGEVSQVSHWYLFLDTTRDPRPGEENGKDYYFVTREVMQRDIAAGDFIEHAEFSGNLYGTSKAAVRAVQAMNRICVLDVDLQGVRNIKKTDLRPIYIFVQPPSLDVLEQRLRQRNTETEESLAKRLAAARADMESSKEPGLFDLIIVNDSLDKAYWVLKEALSEASSPPHPINPPPMEAGPTSK